MLKILYLLFAVSCSLNSLAQSKTFTKYVNHEVIHFEGITSIGERLIGVAPDRETAQKIIADYMKRNQHNKHILTHKTITQITITAQSDIDVIEQFISVCSKGCVLLPIVDYNSICIAKKENTEAAVWYYLKTKNTTPEIAKNKLDHLLHHYVNYVNVY